MSKLAPAIVSRRIIRSLSFALLLSVFTVLSAGTGSPVIAASLEGEAFYRERIVLPPDAVFEAVLQDISLADAPARVLGRARLDPAGNPPFRFTIDYDAGAVLPRHSYSVRATLTQRGRLLFTTDTIYPAFDGGGAPLKLVLVSVPRKKSGTTEFSGLFRYLADAAIITLCSNHRKLPVAMEGDYLALESAYLKTRRRPGEPLLVRVEGLVALRPSLEESAPPRPALVVKRFVDITNQSSCEPSPTGNRMRNTAWKLVQLNGTPVEPTEENRREPHLIFAADRLRLSGSDGCNRFTGAFDSVGGKLRFDHLAGTMMACTDTMDREQRFLQSLKSTAGYRIAGNILELIDEAGKAVARFERIVVH